MIAIGSDFSLSPEKYEEETEFLSCGAMQLLF